MTTAKKNNYTFWFIFGAALIYFVFFDEQPATTTPSGSVVTTPPAGPGYALTTKNNWPAIQQAEGALTDPAQLMNLNYYLVLDGSGSMADTDCADGRPKIKVAVEAVSAFARALPQNANFGLAAFVNGSTGELAPLSTQHEAGLGRLAQLQPSGNTPLFNAAQFGYQKLTAQAQRQLGYGEYHLVLVTDGLASEGQDPTPMVQQIFGESPVVLHTIGFCIDNNHPLNQPGRSFYSAATNPATLKQGLNAVLAESPDFSIDRFVQ